MREALRILEVHGIIKIKSGPGGGPLVTGATTNGDADEAEHLMRDHMAEYARYVEARYPALVDEVVVWH